MRQDATLFETRLSNRYRVDHRYDLITTRNPARLKKEKRLLRETEKAAPSDPSRQGDILRIEYAADSDRSPALGLIINADCDLQNKKTDGVIAYLPIYTFDEYLDSFWCELYLSDVTDSCTKKLLDVLGADEGEAADLRAWLESTADDAILAKIIAGPTFKQSQQSAIADVLNKLRVCANSDASPLARFGQLCRLEKDPAAAARKQLVAAKRAMGDGHFFVSDLVDHSEVGFVIRMRRIYTLPENSCFTSTSSQRANSDGKSTTAVRFARLTPLYQFKVAQLFAQQFSRIGLPDDITALADVAVEVLVSKLSQVVE